MKTLLFCGLLPVVGAYTLASATQAASAADPALTRAKATAALVAREGTLRTERDVISLTPTKDKCIVNAKAKMFFKDGAGEFMGYSGSGVAEVTLNFCGAPGHAVVYGRVCKAS